MLYVRCEKCCANRGIDYRQNKKGNVIKGVANLLQGTPGR